MRYHNYHKHDYYGNFVSLDTITSMEDYFKRAKELGHDTFFTVNHGFQGNMFEAKTLAEKYEMKVIMGAEGYYVPDNKEKDKSNRHIIIIALNDNGARQLNEIMSEAFINGFYYKPRIDEKLLFSLNQNNFVITTACVAGIWSDENLVLRLKEHFKDNFFLEVQNHNQEIQKNANKEILRMHYKYNIPIIHANDSHYIYATNNDNAEEVVVNSKKYKLLEANRDLFLKAKGIIYEEETSFILDYPDYDTIVERYKIQGILTDAEIKEALENTLVFDKAENLGLVNYDIKLPPISDNPEKELKSIIKKSWDEVKHSIPRERWKEYIDAIKYEVDIITKTKMENYFILDHKIVEKAQKDYNGKLTHTGRGSAPSFYTTKLLGLTDIDRLNTPITLFPTRFMSIERIIGAKSLPDIDLNTANAKPFIQATEDLLGKENCAWMIAWKPLQKASAFRLYCKAIGMEMEEYNDVAKDISAQAKIKKESKYEEDDVWGPIIKASAPFVGVVESIAESPCSMLVYDKPVNREIGLIRTREGICCLLDGYNCDKYKYLKNDYLTVQVWAIIKETCDLVGIPVPSIDELNKLLDKETYDIYAKGLTCTINQADSDFATPLVKRYKPKSPSEMSAFVAIIRPGCKSLLEDFLNRKPYTTGVKELDAILEDSGHRMIYQESIMKYLIWLGISEPHSYDIIKKIAKKKFKEQELKELKKQLIDGWKKQVGTEEGFEETWQVVEDASKYSFNASHSLSYAYDSLYGAYLKSHYPLEYYTVVLNNYKDDEDRTNKLIKELPYFGISLLSPQFGKSKDVYFMNKETNSIYKGIASLKYLNQDVSIKLYNLSQENKYDYFTDLLYDIWRKTSLDQRQLEILIKCDYFSQFGDVPLLLGIAKEFKNGKNRIYNTLKEETILKRKEVIRELEINKEIKDEISKIDILRFKMQNGIDFQSQDKSHSNKEFIIADIKFMGKSKKAKAKIYQLSTGRLLEVKFNNIISDGKSVGKYDYIIINNIKSENKWYKDDTETDPNKQWKRYKEEDNQKEFVVYSFSILDKYKE